MGDINVGSDIGNWQASEARKAILRRARELWNEDQPGCSWTEENREHYLIRAAMEAGKQAAYKEVAELNVRVMPLDWNVYPNPNAPHTVLDFPMGYYVHETDKGWRINYQTQDFFPTMEEAQAAAQADFETHVLAVIEMPKDAITKVEADQAVQTYRSSMLGLQYRPNDFDDWGMIRDADGKLFAVVRKVMSEDELDEHRRRGTDPYQEIALRLIDSYENPSGSSSAG